MRSSCRSAMSMGKKTTALNRVRVRVRIRVRIRVRVRVRARARARIRVRVRCGPRPARICTCRPLALVVTPE